MPLFLSVLPVRDLSAFIHDARHFKGDERREIYNVQRDYFDVCNARGAGVPTHDRQNPRTASARRAGLLDRYVFGLGPALDTVFDKAFDGQMEEGFGAHKGNARRRARRRARARPRRGGNNRRRGSTIKNRR